MVAHRAKDGTWDLKRARVDRRGRIVLRTRTFSLNVPAWLNPKTYVESAGNFLARTFGGRTSPVECPARAPDWFGVANLTVSVHACGQNNPDGGGERAEVRIKNNRGAFQQVTLAGSRDYVFVEGQPDALRRAIGAVTGTEAGTTVFLAPGDRGYLTAGYRRPFGTVTYTNLVETTYRSLALSLVYAALDWGVGEVAEKVKIVAWAHLAQSCLGVFDLKSATVKDPRTALSAADFAEVFQCVVIEAGKELANPKKAFGAALQLTEGKLAGYSTKQLTDELTRVGGKLESIGKIFKLFAFRPILQQALQGPIDVLAALISGGSSTHVDVAMQGKPSPTTPADPTAGPGPSGSTPGPVVPGPAQPAAPTSRQITIDNRVTNGGTQMREDQPAYLSTVTRNFCKRDGCALPGTEVGSGNVITAECTTLGDRTTNGQDNSAIDDGNPGLYSSTRWYGIRWGDGRFGYLSEVWVHGADRGGLGLRGC